VARDCASQALRLAYHAKALEALPLTEARGRQIAERYIAQLATQLGEAMTRLREQFEQIATDFEAVAASSGGWPRVREHRPFFAGAVSLFATIAKRVFAPVSSSNAFGQFEEIAVRLEGGELMIAELLLLQDALADSQRS
jgi:hypothetical protein